MAENVVWNKKLLLLALGLAALAVGLFWWREAAREKSESENVVEVLQWSHDMQAGKEIADVDLQVVPVPKTAFKALGNVLEAKDRTSVTGGGVNRTVNKNEFVRWNDLLRGQSKTPSAAIHQGMRAMTLRVDPYYTPGDMLGMSDKIDLIGALSVDGKAPRSYVLIENLLVLGVGGHSVPQEEQFGPAGKDRRYEAPARVYRSVTVEISPEDMADLADLLVRVPGRLWLVVRNPGDDSQAWKMVPGKKTPGINPKLLAVLSRPPVEKPEGSGNE